MRRRRANLLRSSVGVGEAGVIRAAAIAARRPSRTVATGRATRQRSALRSCCTCALLCCKAAILTFAGKPVPVEIEVPLEFKGLDRLGAALWRGFSCEFDS